MYSYIILLHIVVSCSLQGTYVHVVYSYIPPQYWSILVSCSLKSIMKISQWTTNCDNYGFSVCLSLSLSLSAHRVFWLCSVYCPHLLHFSYASDEFPATPEALWSLGNGCRQLQSLHLSPCLTRYTVYMYVFVCVFFLSLFLVLSHIYYA